MCVTVSLVGVSLAGVAGISRGSGAGQTVTCRVGRWSDSSESWWAWQLLAPMRPHALKFGIAVKFRTFAGSDHQTIELSHTMSSSS